MTEPDARITEEQWEALLAAELDCTVQVRYGRARHVVVQARREPRPGLGLELRLSSFFAGAPAQIRTDLARWLRSGRRARASCARLDAWIEERRTELPPLRRRRKTRTRGEHHDLEPLAVDLRAEWFAGGEALELDEERWPDITWGRRGKRPVRHTLRLGSYVHDERIVRIHPVLDQEAVPTWFVRYILFHELLHAACPPESAPDGRLVHHGPEYRRQERRYPDWERAQAWQKAWLGALIRSARTGRPVGARARRAFAPATAAASATDRGGKLGRLLQGWLFPVAGSRAAPEFGAERGATGQRR